MKKNNTRIIPQRLLHLRSVLGLTQTELGNAIAELRWPDIYLPERTLTSLYKKRPREHRHIAGAIPDNTRLRLCRFVSRVCPTVLSPLLNFV